MRCRRSIRRLWSISAGGRSRTPRVEPTEMTWWRTGGGEGRGLGTEPAIRNLPVWDSSERSLAPDGPDQVGARNNARRSGQTPFISGVYVTITGRPPPVFHKW